MEKQFTTAGEVVIGPACNRIRMFKNITAAEQDLLGICNGDPRLLRVALRTAIRERTKLIGRP